LFDPAPCYQIQEDTWDITTKYEGVVPVKRGAYEMIGEIECPTRGEQNQLLFEAMKRGEDVDDLKGAQIGAQAFYDQNSE